MKEAKKLLLTPKQYFDFQTSELQHLRKKYPRMTLVGKIMEPEFWDDKRATKPSRYCYGWCAAYTTDITISPDGRTLPCAWFAAYPEFYGENILTSGGIKSVWKTSDKIMQFRRIKINGKCTRCEFSGTCYKGCQALKYALFNRF
ncbi:MAG: hypothetical protein CVT47_03210, partial [Thermoplasmata archaeon HGW-Thermoplasmata-2]